MITKGITLILAAAAAAAAAAATAQAMVYGIRGTEWAETSVGFELTLHTAFATLTKTLFAPATGRWWVSDARRARIRVPQRDRRR